MTRGIATEDGQTNLAQKDETDKAKNHFKPRSSHDLSSRNSNGGVSTLKSNSNSQFWSQGQGQQGAPQQQAGQLSNLERMAEASYAWTPWEDFPSLCSLELGKQRSSNVKTKKDEKDESAKATGGWMVKVTKGSFGRKRVVPSTHGGPESPINCTTEFEDRFPDPATCSNGGLFELATAPQTTGPYTPLKCETGKADEQNDVDTTHDADDEPVETAVGATGVEQDQERPKSHVVVHL